jgi:hypothetical protein
MTDDSRIQIYQSPDGETCVDVRFEKETVWLTQRQMGEVFDTTPENVLMHLKNIYKTGELPQDSTAKDFLVVQTKRYFDQTDNEPVVRAQTFKIKSLKKGKESHGQPNQ